MLKGVDDSVEQGEILGRTSGLFGFFSSESRAVVTGTIQSISSVTGTVILQARPVPVEIDAYINGKVVEVIPARVASSRRRQHWSRGSSGSAAKSKGSWPSR